jgi:hypothetical protein
MSAAKRDPRNALIEALAAALRDCRDYLPRGVPRLG